VAALLAFLALAMLAPALAGALQSRHASKPSGAADVRAGHYFGQTGQDKNVSLRVEHRNDHFFVAGIASSVHGTCMGHNFSAVFNGRQDVRIPADGDVKFSPGEVTVRISFDGEKASGSFEHRQGICKAETRFTAKRTSSR
jgi:hypothetical protein